ncbi:hypothetical protein FJY63_11590, partial [Candidatus Sumerlaeota bacterium]|nr:hypothetical protein [Candidatus Sumerlaeota bacterium]
DVEPFDETADAMPDDYVVEKIGLDRYVRTVAASLVPAPRGSSAWLREQHMAWQLRLLRRRYKSVLFVCDIGHLVRVAQFYMGQCESVTQPVPSRDAFVAHLDEASLGRALRETPYLVHLYENARETGELADGWKFDKLEALRSLFLTAEQTYRKRYKEEITLTQWRALLQYTRNLALMHMHVCPESYEVVVGAKNIVDGDFGATVHEIAFSYPPQRDFSPFPILHLLPRDRGRLGDEDETLWLKPRPPRSPEHTVKVRFRRRATRRERKVWRELWDRSFHYGICSWPPEDKIQENFMRYVRKRALQVVSEDKKRVEEFTTSFCDGLDIRETMRNWHRRQIYVQYTPPPRGQVGPVVLIFADEPIERVDSWRETLYAEHQNESDISFYADPLGGHVVGPGICETHFRGILSVFPAKRIPDVWLNPTIDEYPWCSEKLLAAAIFYSDFRYVAYVAAKPPSAAMRQLASYNSREIIYLPISMFARLTLRKIRKFHILDGHHVRTYAADYIS